MRVQTRTSRAEAFTLIEMVGVLAVIAILAGLLTPKIFSAVNEARLTSAVTACATVKSAATTYFTKYNKFGGIRGAALTNATSTAWDTGVLIVEGLIDKPFEPRLGDTADVLVSDALAATVAAAGDNTAYNLDNRTDYNTNDAAGAKVVECVFNSVTREDAWEMSWRIDGSEFTAASKDTASDLVGRVKYNIANAVGQVRVYISHK